MTCHECENDVALYAGGDLPEAAALESHLAGCPNCRALLSDLKGLRDDLAGLRDVALPALPVLRPRRKVLWPWAAGAIAAGLALLLIPRPADIAPPARIAWAPPAPRVEAPKPHPAAPPRPRVAVVKSVVPPAAPDTEFVKLVSEDDEVVILWAMNSKGELP